MTDSPYTPPPPRWHQRLRRPLLQGVRCYVIILLVLLLLEDFLLYHPSGASQWHNPPARLGIQDVDFPSADGTSIHAWWFAPQGWQPAQGAFLFCHGNGGNLSWRSGAFTAWHQEHHFAVLMLDYPGYGKSGGKPSEAGCYAAADAAYDWLTGVHKVPPRRIVLWGGSLGTGVAVDLAVRRPCRAVFLVAPFTSIPDMAQRKFPWLPARWLVHNQFDNLAKVPNLHVPLFITHDQRDGLIPFSQGEGLFAAAPQPKQFFATDHARHHDVPTGEVWPALEAFLSQYAPAAD